MNQLQDRVALVTGASRGLGKAIAIAYAREGAGLAICARDLGRLEETAEVCRELGADVLTIQADVASAAGRERLVTLALDHFGRVDILVNNASTLGPTPLPLLADTEPDAFEAVIRTNLIAPFLLARALAGGMLLRGSGLIVNVSSDAAVNGYPGWGAYSAAKAGLDGLTRVWAAEVAPFGVTVVSVDPGDMDTEMHRAALPDDDPSQLARPEDVAEAFVRLAGGETAGPRLEARELMEVAG